MFVGISNVNNNINSTTKQIYYIMERNIQHDAIQYLPQLMKWNNQKERKSSVYFWYSIKYRLKYKVKDRQSLLRFYFSQRENREWVG